METRWKSCRCEGGRQDGEGWKSHHPMLRVQREGKCSLGKDGGRETGGSGVGDGGVGMGEWGVGGVGEGWERGGVNRGRERWGG